MYIYIHIFVESALISCSVLNSYIKRFHLLPTLFSLSLFFFFRVSQFTQLQSIVTTDTHKGNDTLIMFPACIIDTHM